MTIFDPPAKQKLATEEVITEKKFLNTLYLLITTAESQKLILNFSMSVISFSNTAVYYCPISLDMKPRSPNFSLPKLKAADKKVFQLEVSNLKYKTGG